MMSEQAGVIRSGLRWMLHVVQSDDGQWMI